MFTQIDVHDYYTIYTFEGQASVSWSPHCFVLEPSGSNWK